MSSDRDNLSASALPSIAGFEILQLVGEGGMGAVYRAKQLSLDRIVALKVLSPKLAADPKYTDSFLREARSAARLNHPNIIPIYDAGKADDLYYYTMEFIHGESLQKWVARDGALPESTALDLALCVANALKFAWDKAQLIHRDIKPDNIIIDTHGNVKLCDLGLAKYFGESTLLSLSGQVFGTPNYMSPEQARAESVDCRTDIYALGLTLYYALTAKTPFQGGTAAMVMARHMSELLPDPRDLVPTISVHTVRIIEKMTSKKADDRYASWDDVIRDLQRAREGNPPLMDAFFNGNSSIKRNTVGVQPVAVQNGGTGVSPVDQNKWTGGTPVPPSPKSRQPLLLAIVAILCLALGGGTAWFFASFKSSPALTPSGTTQQPLNPSSPPPQNPIANLNNSPPQNPIGAAPPEQSPTAQDEAQAQKILDDILRRAQGTVVGGLMRLFPTPPAQVATELQNLIAQYPNTPAAQQAKLELAKLQNPPPATIAPTTEPMSDAQLRELTIGTWEKTNDDGSGKPILMEFNADGTIRVSSSIRPWKVENGVVKEFWPEGWLSYTVIVPGKEMKWTKSRLTQVLRKVQDATAPQTQPSAIGAPPPSPPDAALKGVTEHTSQPKTAKEWEKLDGTLVTVGSDRIGSNPLPTGVRVTKGLHVFIAAHPDDKWTCNNADYHDFRGMRRTPNDTGMAMMYRLGSQVATIPETPFAATEDGELSLFANDMNIHDNRGAIRVKIIVKTAHQIFAESDEWKKLQALGDFQKSFLAALTQRDYAGAQRQAQNIADNPLFESLKDRATAFAAVAQRLQQFWTKGLPEALAQLKGKEITVRGEKGVLAEIKDGNLELEKAVTGGSVVADVPLAKLTLEEITSFVALANPNHKETRLTLAWLYFAEGKQSQAQTRLTELEKSGADTKETRQVMEWLSKPPEIPRADAIPPNPSSPAAVVRLSDEKLRELMLGRWEASYDAKPAGKQDMDLRLIDFFPTRLVRHGYASSNLMVHNGGGNWNVGNGIVSIEGRDGVVASWKLSDSGAELVGDYFGAKVRLKKIGGPDAIEADPNPKTWQAQPADPDAKLREQTIGTWEVYDEKGQRIQMRNFSSDGTGYMASWPKWQWKVEDGNVKWSIDSANWRVIKVITAGHLMECDDLGKRCTMKKVEVSGVANSDAKLREQTIGTWDFYHEEGNKSGVTYQFLADGSLKISSVPGMPFQWKAEGGVIKLGQDFKDVWKINVAGKEMQRAVPNTRGTATLKKAQ